MVIGTPEYMSPEQAMGKRGDEIDGRSDLYSLGIVMYRMLTGELPFQAETTVEMILEHLKTPPMPPHKLKPELAIPEAVSAIVMKALEKDREKRFATGAEMAAAIKRAARQHHSPLAQNRLGSPQQRGRIVLAPRLPRPARLPRSRRRCRVRRLPRAAAAPPRRRPKKRFIGRPPGLGLPPRSSPRAGC